MRVLHVFKTYLPDTFTGIERVIWEIAEGLAPEGVETHVLTVSKEASASPRPIGRHFVRQSRCSLNVASTPLSLSLFKDFRALAPSFDVIHYHFPWPMMDLLHLGSGVRRPSVVTYHSDVVRQHRLLVPYLPIMHRFLSSADSIVATSPNYVQTSPVLKCYLDKVETIPIGMSEVSNADPSLIDKWRRSVGEGFFLFVGALRYYKGLPFLLEAAERTGLPVVIVGKGEYADEIKRRALPSVTHLSDVSDEDKLALLSLCKAFVFPSHRRSEAFGVALIEAARAARPMISCEIGTGTTFVNRHGETGLVIPPADPDALGQAMRAIDDRPEMAMRLGQAARARFENHFRSEQMCARYLRLYRTVAESAASTRVRAPAPEPGVALGASSKGYSVREIKHRSSLFNTDWIDRIHEPHGQGVDSALDRGDLTDASGRRIIQLVQPDQIHNLAAQSHVAVSVEGSEYAANANAMRSTSLRALRSNLQSTSLGDRIVP